jgi:acid phosphatase
MPATRPLALPVVVLATGALAVGPAQAAEPAPASKTQYLQSGQYAKDVTAAAAPATAWVRERAADIRDTTAACRAYGLPVGTNGAATQPTVHEPTAAERSAARKARTAARAARKRATAARRAARRSGLSRSARAAATKRARTLAARATRLERRARAAAAAAKAPDVAKPAAEACRATPTKPAIVFDIDETLLSNYIGVPAGNVEAGSLGQFPGALTGTGTRMPGVGETYDAARAAGFSIFLVTARPDDVPGLRDTTIRNLKAARYPVWDGLSLKPSFFASSATYKTGERKGIEARGFTIVANVGDQESDLVGGFAERTFKLPNPFYSG